MGRPAGAGVPSEDLGIEDGVVADADGLLMLNESEAGGPTGTMREPNSTPIVTS